MNKVQHAATHCNSQQHTATLCNTLQHTATHCNTLQHTCPTSRTRAALRARMPPRSTHVVRRGLGVASTSRRIIMCCMYVGLCSSVLQCVAVCRSVLQCVAVCCSVLQCVAVCCSVLQCVAVCCSMTCKHQMPYHHVLHVCSSV